MRSITWKNQRKNKSDFGNAGKFSSWDQCFTSDSVMFMSFYCPDIHGDDNDFTAKYLFDIEDALNKSGLGEKIVEQNHLDPAAHSSYFFAVQAAGITNYLNNYGVSGQAIVKEFFPIADLPNIVANRPVIIGTHKLGGLPNGHMILLVDYDPELNAFKVNDSFGDANTGYQNQDGDSVIYDFERLKPRLEIDAAKYPGKCNILYFEPA